MRVYPLRPLSVCDTNSFIVASDENNCVLIDAPDEADYILEQIDIYGLELKKIFLTHGHFDHIGAVADLVEETGCEVYIHEKDLSKLLSGDADVSRFFGLRSARKVKKAIPIGADDELTLDELVFDVLHTPGHTSGSVCYICKDCMFTGDTLFDRSIGRTDMPDGDPEVMKQSLRKICSLGGNLKIYPGHMSNTTLDRERKYNPYLIAVGGI
ncbi:MAG: MBL fold metallo-hydrolase [Ruminococcus sp.]|nr:MBL fold metallo-hydrolase [Ruminococcus sp.]